MKSIVATPLAVWLAAAASSAGASVAIPVMECPNCTPVAMQNMAKNTAGIGVKFVYDLPHHIIRKYEVYMDSTCGQPPATEGAGSTDTVFDTDCGSFKAADPFDPVDPDVQATFDALYHAWQVNPALINLHKAERVGNLPVDSVTGAPFDLPKVAWDYPQGSYNRFRGYLQNNVLDTPAHANAFIPGFGDELFGWAMAGFDVQVTVVRGAPQVGATLHYDRNTGLFQLRVCNANGDCAQFEIHVSNGSITGVDYEGVFNVDDQLYPSASGAAPGSLLHWEFALASDAEHFADQLRHRGVYVPIRQACAAGMHWGLVGARVNGVLQSSTWMCTSL